MKNKGFHGKIATTGFSASRGGRGKTHSILVCSPVYASLFPAKLRKSQRESGAGEGRTCMNLWRRRSQAISLKWLARREGSRFGRVW